MYDNVNPAMVNGNDIMSSMFATLKILSERLDLRRSILCYLGMTAHSHCNAVCEWQHCVANFRNAQKFGTYTVNFVM